MGLQHCVFQVSDSIKHDGKAEMHASSEAYCEVDSNSVFLIPVRKIKVKIKFKIFLFINIAPLKFILFKLLVLEALLTLETTEQSI